MMMTTTMMGLLGRFAFLTALIFVFQHVSPASSQKKNQIGKICHTDGECGLNEHCNIPKIVQPPCKSGYCACKPCYTNITANAACTPVHIERPCDLACHNGTRSYEDCDDWCEDTPPQRMLTPFATCQHFNRGLRSRRVICDTCYESKNRQCVQKVSLGNGAACSDDCACSSNLKCNGKCMCLTTNERWDNNLLTCVRRELGDLCIVDRDCDVEPDDEQFGQFYRGLACVNGRCRCAANFTSTDISFIDDNSNIITRPICIANGAVTKLGEREKCTFKTIYDGRFPNTKLCAPGLLCMSCGDNPTKICRNIVPVTGNASTSTNMCRSGLHAEQFISTTAIGKVGIACSKDQHCGTREVCFKANVIPPCLDGQCQCKQCHAPGSDKYCVPIEVLDLGIACANRKGVEIYPEHADCQDGVVKCATYYKQAENRCVPDVDRYAMPGDDCTSTANCFGALVCSASVTTSSSMNKQPRLCGCRTGDNQHWDRSLKKCTGPRVGDPCINDAECNSVYLLPPSAQLRVCINNKCSCKPEHTYFQGNCYGPDDNMACFRCPEDRKNSSCRTLYAVKDAPIQEAESCLASLSANLYKIENSPGKIRNCSADARQETHKVGSACSDDVQCGPNEFCKKDDFMPVCEFGKCTCKRSHDIGPNNTCSPFVLMKLGQMCFSTRNEIYHQLEGDVMDSSFPLRCADGIVRCNQCYDLDPHTLRCVRKQQGLKGEGDRCEQTCECQGDGQMICDEEKRCSCRSPSENFDEMSKTCRLREIWTPCYKGSDCNKSAYTTDGGICANGFCTCRQQYMATFTGFYDGLNITSKQICVLSQAKTYVNKRLGSSCAMDPVQNSGSLSMLHGGICASGLVCVSCDGDDDDEPTRGICRKFVDGRSITDAPSREELIMSVIRQSLQNRAAVLWRIDSYAVTVSCLLLLLLPFQLQ